MMMMMKSVESLSEVSRRSIDYRGLQGYMQTAVTATETHVSHS